jgi:hypothetical protein
MIEAMKTPKHKNRLDSSLPTKIMITSLEKHSRTTKESLIKSLTMWSQNPKTTMMTIKLMMEMMTKMMMKLVNQRSFLNFIMFRKL